MVPPGALRFWILLRKTHQTDHRCHVLRSNLSYTGKLASWLGSTDPIWLIMIIMNVFTFSTLNHRAVSNPKHLQRSRSSSALRRWPCEFWLTLSSLISIHILSPPPSPIGKRRVGRSPHDFAIGVSGHTGNFSSREMFFTCHLFCLECLRFSLFTTSFYSGNSPSTSIVP